MRGYHAQLIVHKSDTVSQAHESIAIGLVLSAFSFIPFVLNVRAHLTPTLGHLIEDAISNSYRNVTDACTLRALESWQYNSLINVYTDLSLPDTPINELLLLIFTLAFSSRNKAVKLGYALVILLVSSARKRNNIGAFPDVASKIILSPVSFPSFSALSIIRVDLVVGFGLILLILIIPQSKHDHARNARLNGSIS